MATAGRSSRPRYHKPSTSVVLQAGVYDPSLARVTNLQLSFDSYGPVGAPDWSSSTSEVALEN